jgi:hypothetical protein
MAAKPRSPLTLLWSLAATSMLAGACASSGDGDDHPFPAPAPEDGFQMSMSTTAPAGTEIWRCAVYDIPTEDWAPVNRVESLQNDFMHHMDVMALAFTGVKLEPGMYDCDDLYANHPGLMDGLILYASQEGTQTIQLPEGTVAHLPPGLRVLHAVHYVNTTSEDVDVFSYVNAYTIHPRDIVETIWGEAVRDVNLEIPPRGEHTEWTRCVMTEDIDLLFLSSHTHQLGKRVSIRLFDGEEVGEEVYVNRDWHAPLIKPFETPLRIAAGTGFEFSCLFDNPTDETVRWGFSADDEMCQIALVFTPGEARRRCVPVDSSDGLHDAG